VSSRIKFALMRSNDVPIGEPGHVFIECPCGHHVEVEIRDPLVKFVRCFRCAAEYDRTGWVIVPSTWDRPAWCASGARERLWLLAHFGPVALKPAEWRYDARRDDWEYIGRDFTLTASRVKVNLEASACVARLERAWRTPRADAMRMIGFPEKD
jgi:hypothetical protein